MPVRSAVLWLQLWRGPSSPLPWVGLGGSEGGHCPSARPFFGHRGSDRDHFEEQTVLSMPIFFPRRASLRAGARQSCHCRSPLKGSSVWLEWPFNPIPPCVQFPSSPQSRSSPTPRLPTPLMRTSPSNVRPEETPSPREYCLEKQTEAELAFNLCQTLLWLSGAAAQ